MKFVLIKKIFSPKINSYFYHTEVTSEFDNTKLEILGEWFTDDLSDCFNPWREWFNDDSSEDTDSNATWLEKNWLPDGTCTVTFGALTDLIQARGVYVEDPNRVVKMPKTNVLELIDTWEEMLRIKPDEIMITEENGIYKMFAVQ